MNSSPLVLDVRLVDQAVSSLLQHESQKRKLNAKNALLDDDSIIIVMQIGLKKIPQRGRGKPYLLQLPSPLNSNSSICIISKDPQRKYKDLVAEAGLTSQIGKVISIDKLKKKFKQYEQRRELSSMYDMFLCDEALLPMLSKILGKSFFQKKKLPIPIDMSRGARKFAKTISVIKNSTCLWIGSGPCSAIKVGHTDMTAAAISANILSIIQQAIEKIPGRSKNIQSIHIKTPESLALPVYNSLPSVVVESAGRD